MNMLTVDVLSLEVLLHAAQESEQLREKVARLKAEVVEKDNLIEGLKLLDVLNKQEVDKLQSRLNEIGNILGGPVMSYVTEVALKEYEERIQKISVLLAGKKGE